MNPANFALDRASSDFDIRHRLVGSLLYELPFGKGKPFLNSASGVVNAIAGGWQLNVIPSFQSGVVRNVTSPNTSTIAYITQRADATGLDPFSSFTRNGVTINPGKGMGTPTVRFTGSIQMRSLKPRRCASAHPDEI